MINITNDDKFKRMHDDILLEGIYEDDHYEKCDEEDFEDFDREDFEDDRVLNMDCYDI